MDKTQYYTQFATPSGCRNNLANKKTESSFSRGDATQRVRTSHHPHPECVWMCAFFVFHTFRQSLLWFRIGCGNMKNHFAEEKYDED